MEQILNKLKELEQERKCIEKCQMNLREQMMILDKDEYLKKEIIYQKNKEELKETNRKIEILNNALDIIENIGI